MKKLILLFLITLGSLYAQKIVTLKETDQDTIKTTQKYVLLNPQFDYQCYKLTLWTTTGTDTIHVASLTSKGGYYVDVALGDLSTGQVIPTTSTLAITTTKKEYVILDPLLSGIKIYSNDGSCNTVFIITGKTGYNLSFSSPTQNSTITQFPNSLTYADVRNSWDWARSFTTYQDTVKTDSVLIVRSRDTLTIGGSEWAKVTIRGTSATDSLYFGVGTTAPTTWTKVIGTTPFVTAKLNHTYFTKVFIKGYGAADSIKSYEVTIEAF